LARYEAGLLGDGVTKGIGLPPPEQDPERLRLDFMPMIERTVQQNGISIDRFTYYHPCIDRWIKALDPENPKKHREFTCRRDPRDISFIWFLDPELNTYFKVPSRDTSLPAISLWEMREAKRELVAQGRSEVNEHAIIEAWERMEARTSSEVRQTQQARRDKQRK
jgi:putative transposase